MHSFKTPLLLLIITTILTVSSFSRTLQAQSTSTLKGSIINAKTDASISDANIVIAGTNFGTSSDWNGMFKFSHVPTGNYNLIITVIGFKKKSISVRLPQKNNKLLRIFLQPEVKEIGDINIIGFKNILTKDSSITREPISMAPAISKVTNIEIEQQGAVTLIDAMKYIPGAWVETRGRKVKQFFSVRGQKYPYPEYSINGVWQKEFHETGYFLSTSNIESIEIVRSSAALIKGLSGLTGIIDVKTIKPKEEIASVGVKYGSLNTYKADLQYGNTTKKISYNASASLFGTDGPGNRGGKERIGNINGWFEWQLNSRLKLSANTILIHGLREFVKPVAPADPKFINRDEKYDPVQTVLTSVKLDYTGKDNSKTELQTNFAYRNPLYSVYNISNNTFKDYRETDYEYSINILHSRSLNKNNILRFGGLYNHWSAPEGKRFYYGKKADVQTFSAVVADEHKTGRFVFDGGLRLISEYINEWGGFSIEGSGGKFSAVKPIEDEYMPLVWQSTLGTSYLLSQSSSLHMSFTGGNIAPRKGSLTAEGTALENETRLQYDAGFKKASMNGDMLSFSIFYINRKNAIGYSGSTIESEGDIMELYENRDKQNYGIELDMKKIIPNTNLSLFANSTFMLAKYLKDGKMKEDSEVPKIIANGGATFNNSSFDVNIFANYTGPYENDRFVAKSWIAENGKAPLGDFFTLNLTAGYSFGKLKQTRFYIEANNITDVKYQTVAGFPDPGRMFFTGIKISF
jgi:outer membrane receptor protein involved in Fe transport